MRILFAALALTLLVGCSNIIIINPMNNGPFDGPSDTGPFDGPSNNGPFDGPE